MGFLARFMRSSRTPGALAEGARLDEMIERVVAMESRLRLAKSYRKRLGGSIRISLRYIDDLTGSLPAPHEANTAAWSTDPLIRAFFATAEDLPKAFSRSETLREYFACHPDITHAHVTLGMAMIERHVLGVALEGDSVRHEVPQTKLCFMDHRVSICARSDPELREEIVRRMIDQLALEGLAKLAADRRELVEKGRELLEARVKLLEQRGTGIRFLVGDAPDTAADELKRLQAQIEENACDLAALRVPTEAIELELERVCEVFSKPAEHIYVENRSVRLDLMNVVRNDETQASRVMEFRLARIPGDPPRMRAFALVRFPRAELLPAGLHIDAATLASWE
ncbi:hypothetical protein [Paraburkholderia sacchari]|uniref:hypothetical protein n=1 Tax=Paraburkholderia sacchari TaxID=159450 RepID=UPI000542B1F4|nr:hypothetical protein [Paraburkholderia sacchari]NLP63765.1 hypothetical protein [Paraburkholderia sacchari]